MREPIVRIFKERVPHSRKSEHKSPEVGKGLQEKQRNQSGGSAVSGRWPNEKGSQDQIRFQPAKIRCLWLLMGTMWGAISRF